MANRYTNAQELELLFPKIISTSLTKADINEIFVTKAEADIDAAVSGRYTLPFSSTPPLVRNIAQDLTMYYVARRMYTQNAKDKNDWVDDFRANAFDILDKIREGEINLITSSKEIISTRTDQVQIWSDASDTTDYNPTMDERDQILQRVDPRLLDDLQDRDDNADI
jgi:phage gp36-like protein